MLATNYSFGLERDEEALVRNDGDHTKWSNPLEVRLVYARPSHQDNYKSNRHRLPNAPSMKMYCVYGHGKDTEVRQFPNI